MNETWVDRSSHPVLILTALFLFLLQFSNVFFLVFGPLMMFLMHPYAQKRSRAVYYVSVLFMAVGTCECMKLWECSGNAPSPNLTTSACLHLPTGVFSMYFHMTLSFMGQMLDEISILWLLSSGYAVWMPRCYFPKFIKGNR